MAISDKGRRVANEGATAVKTVNAKSARVDYREQGKQIYSKLSEEQRDILGSKSGDLEFIALITNPYRTVTRTVNGKPINGEESVGAILKNVGKEDIVVNQIPNKSPKVMDADFENVSEVTVKPGEEFQVNWIEVAALLTRPEYGSKATGGGKQVSYSASSSKAVGLPTTRLNIAGGSIKDHGVSIADTSKGADGKAVRTVKPEFAEKFGIFSQRGVRKTGVSGASAKRKTSAVGLAVQNLFQQKLNTK